MRDSRHFAASTRRKGPAIADRLKQPAEWFETEQQTTCHLVGSQCPDDVLVHCQDIAQAAIKGPLLIDGPAACRLVGKLHHLDANADDVRKGGGE